MIFCVDIGNTDVVFGIWENNQWISSWRNPTIKDHQAPLYYEIRIRNHLLENKLHVQQIGKVVISSVVPHLTDVLINDCRNIFQLKVHNLGPNLYKKLSMEIPRPNEIGADLVANAFASWRLYQSNCIIVDFGTALTYTAVTGEGKILGVSIAPGIKTAIKALSSKTAQLPIVPLELPDSALGQDTVHAIQAGVLYGYSGMIRSMIEKLKEELGTDFKVVATGGLSTVLKDLHIHFDHYNPHLTLEGLRLICEEVSVLNNS